MAGSGIALAARRFVRCSRVGGRAANDGRRLELLLRTSLRRFDPALVAQPPEATIADALFEPLVRRG